MCTGIDLKKCVHREMTLCGWQECTFRSSYLSLSKNLSFSPIALIHTTLCVLGGGGGGEGGVRACVCAGVLYALTLEFFFI